MDENQGITQGSFTFLWWFDMSVEGVFAAFGHFLALASLFLFYELSFIAHSQSEESFLACLQSEIHPSRCQPKKSWKLYKSKEENRKNPAFDSSALSYLNSDQLPAEVGWYEI